MIDPKIESFVDKFVSGDDLTLANLDYPKEDKAVCDAIVLRLNFLKHCYIRAQKAGNGDMAVHLFSRMCMLVPGFMIAE